MKLCGTKNFLPFKMEFMAIFGALAWIMMSNIRIAKTSPCNSTTEFQIQAGSEHPINCSVKLDQKDDATGVVINFNIDNQLLTSKIPILTVFSKLKKIMTINVRIMGPR